MKHFIKTILVLCLLVCSQNLFAQCACSGNCDYVFTTSSTDTDFTADELKAAMGVSSLAGKRICIQAGTYINKRFTFRNVEGTLTEPIIFKNCDGLVTIDNENSTTSLNALIFWDAKYIKVMGNSCAGPPNNITYGIRAKSNTNHVEASALSGRITDIEMAWLEVGGDSGTPGSAGIKIIDQPGCGTDTISDRNSPERWVIRNIHIHDNYLHNIGHEGMYIGKGDNWYTAGGFPSACPTTRSYSPSIKGVRLYNNKIRDTGWDGLQLKDADDDVKVHNNDIRNFGLANNGSQNEGMVLGAGCVGDIYQNVVINGTGWGVFYKGLGNMNFHNNIISNTGNDGMYLNGNEGMTTASNSYLRIVNNTIVKTGESGIELHQYNTEIDNRVLVNNIIAEVNPSFSIVTGAGASAFNVRSNNLENRDATELDFVSYSESAPGDFLNNDYHLQATSPAVDAGLDVSGYAADSITFDFDGNPRNVNGSYDIGAYEYGSGGGEAISLFINAGGEDIVEEDHTWERDKPHATLDNSYLTYYTGSPSAFGGVNETTAPSEVLGTSRYTLNSGTTIRYDIPVPAPGNYDIELFFARKNGESWTSGGRRFNIFIEEQNITTYDVYDEGGPNGTAASSFPYTASVTDGMLEIKLVAVAQSHSMINAIHVQGPVGSQSGRKVTDEVVSEEGASSAVETAVFPNPASGHINISAKDERIHAIRITNIRSDVVLSETLDLQDGESRKLDISALRENELYIIHLQSSRGMRTLKLFKVTK